MLIYLWAQMYCGLMHCEVGFVGEDKEL